MIRLERAGPGVSVQDQGRGGYLAQGISRGGALDPVALLEGAVLLGQSPELAALEIMSSFAALRFERAARIALTGAPMRALCEGAGLGWNACHWLPAGARLELGASRGGVSYIHFGGGIDVPLVLGARSVHLAAGIGRMLVAGDVLALGGDQDGPTGRALTPLERFEAGVLRMIETPQTALFDADTRARFLAAGFTKDTRANRMGARLAHDGGGFAAQTGLVALSEPVVPGDIQIAGDGAPFVLLAECQTTGGYPRIGTVLPCDLPRLVQAQPGAVLRFAFVTLEEADAIEAAHAARLAALPETLRPLTRDPRTMRDLLAYQLVSGVTCGDDLDRGM